MRLSLELQPFLPLQWEAFRFDPPPGEIGVTALLGGWGSGKTHGAARKFLRRCLENGWTEAYGQGNPTSMIVAPTNKVLTQATLAQFYEVCPPELILKDRGPPYSDILLVNGHRILKHSGEGMLEGLSACGCWIDEVHKPVFSQNPHRYLNYLARLRDPHAKRKEMIVSGLPTSGWVCDTFGYEASNMKTVLMPTKSNKYIDSALIDVFYQNCPSGEQRMLLGGQWLPVEGSIYGASFDASVHVTDAPYREEDIAHIGIDIGDHGAMIVAHETEVMVRNVIGQTSKSKGLLIVADILTKNKSVDEMCYFLKTQTPWRVSHGSTICIDPMVRRDELAAVRKHFPNARIVKREKGHETFPVENGIRIVSRAMQDALGNVRLKFRRELMKTHGGLIAGIVKYRRDEKTGVPAKDNRVDHCLDAMRYVVCENLRPERPTTRVL